MAGTIAAMTLVASLAMASPQPPDAPKAEAPKAETPSPKLSSRTPLVTLMANPPARDVLRKYLPQIVELLEGGGAAQAPPDFTLENLQSIPRAGVTPEILKSINDDLAKL